MGGNINLGVGGRRRPVGRRMEGDGDGVRETSLQGNNFVFHLLLQPAPPETGRTLWLLGELFQMGGVFDPLRVGVRVRSGTNTKAWTRAMVSLPGRATRVPGFIWHPLAVVVIS